MDHAIISGGNPVVIARTTYTTGGAQYSPGTLDNMPRAGKLALTPSVYEVVLDTVPAGQHATAWAYAVVGDYVEGTPTLEPLPVVLTADDVASSLAPAATSAQGLTVGRYYTVGQTVLEGGTTYNVIQPFLYANPQWTVASLAAHLVANATATWAPSTAYALNAEVSYLGVSYKCLQPHTSQVGWEPTATPALWQVL